MMHKAQINILYTLRHSQSARFSELMRHTTLESDTFKFHVRKLILLKYVHKLNSGDYALTPAGKEFANNLNKKTREIQKQPKLSILLVVSRESKEGQTSYLFQKRKRSPYYGYWGTISGPARWDEEFEVTASSELKKQTGLSATFEVKSFYRQKDYDTATNSILEDKLFVILEALDTKGKLTNTWPHGFNQWMTVEQLKRQDKYFALTTDILTNGECSTYRSVNQLYELDNY